MVYGVRVCVVTDSMSNKEQIVNEQNVKTLVLPSTPSSSESFPLTSSSSSPSETASTSFTSKPSKYTSDGIMAKIFCRYESIEVASLLNKSSTSSSLKFSNGFNSSRSLILFPDRFKCVSFVLALKLFKPFEILWMRKERKGRYSFWVEWKICKMIRLIWLAIAIFELNPLIGIAFSIQTESHSCHLTTLTCCRTIPIFSNLVILGNLLTTSNQHWSNSVILMLWIHL